MAFAVVNGVRLYYERHGDSGEALVFVHGYTGDVSDWRLQVAEFSSRYRVLAMDLRGHGRSEALPDRAAYSVWAMTTDVESLVDEVGFERYHLVGHSMGGAIAQEMALHRPERLLSLTLEDTTYRFTLPSNDDMFQLRAQRLNAAMTQGMAAAAALPLPWTPPHMPAERVVEVRERLSGLSLDTFVGAAQGLVGWEGTEDRASSISTPTLVVYGDLDAPVLVESSRRLSELIPNASLVVIAEAEHSPQWERPELFNAALWEHLEENSG